ncbi:MAG: pirin family protein [Dehalococcoidia bacterium]
MHNKISSENLYVANRGWLISRFHFSFAEYYNPQNVHFGVLRVLNDDIVQPSTGFGTHPHENMEIVSYCIEGELTHMDNMGNKETLRHGDVQYMSAGTGITHSEMNDAPDELLRFLQIWILPDKQGATPQYGSKRFSKSDRHNKLLHIVSGKDINSVIQINQDANIFVSEIEKGKQVVFSLDAGRQIYLVCIEGSLDINGIELNKRDAVEISNETQLTFKALQNAHLLMIEMAQIK